MYIGHIAVYTTYIDATYCYRQGSLVCLSVGRSFISPEKNGWTDREFQDAVRVVDYGGPKAALLDGVLTWATWRIRLNCPCAAAMRPFVKLLWFVIYVKQQIIDKTFCPISASASTISYRAVGLNRKYNNIWGNLAPGNVSPVSCCSRVLWLQRQRRLNWIIVPRLHDTTGCHTGYTTGLTTGFMTTGCIHDTAGCKTGCQTGLTTGLTTGCIV